MELPARLPDAPHPRVSRLMEAAQSMEAQFLSEMLKSAGIGKTPEAS